MFWRRKPPGGEEVSDEYAAGMRAMEAWYHEFVIWAYAYISLLEKQLQKRNVMDMKKEAPAGEGREAVAEIYDAIRDVLLAVDDLRAENEALRMELRDERDRFDRLTDFELAEAKMLERSLRAVESSGWIRVEDRLPEDAEEIVLVFVSGQPNKWERLEKTYELATYNSEDGWILDAYPEWEMPGVTHWMPLPDGPGEPARKGGAE